MIDPGIVPERPSFPNIPLNVGIALFAAMVLSVLWICARAELRGAEGGVRIAARSGSRAGMIDALIAATLAVGIDCAGRIRGADCIGAHSRVERSRCWLRRCWSRFLVDPRRHAEPLAADVPLRGDSTAAASQSRSAIRARIFASWSRRWD